MLSRSRQRSQSMSLLQRGENAGSAWAKILFGNRSHILGLFATKTCQRQMFRIASLITFCVISMMMLPVNEGAN